MKHKWIILILIVALIAVIWRVSGGKTESTELSLGRSRMMQAIPVEAEEIEYTDISEWASFSGDIEAKSNYLAAPKISGQLRRLHVDIGMKVQKGDLLAELDDRVLRQEIKKARAAVEIAEASARQSGIALEFATTELERKRELQSRAFIAQSEFDAAYNQYSNAVAQDEIAKANLASASAALESAELQISFCQIRADWNDDAPYRVIAERYADEGEQLNAGSPIVALMDISTVITAIDVIERDYARIRQNQIAHVQSDSYPDKRFKGRVARISPILQEASRQARVEIEVINSGELLKPGMFARVELLLNTKNNARAVSEKALTKIGDREGVYLIDENDDTVRFIEIQTGITGSGKVEIIDPPIEGKVVTLGQDMLADGRKVTLTRVSSPAR